MSDGHERREALARVIDPEAWEFSDDPRFDSVDKSVRETVRDPSLRLADRLIESGILAGHEWDRQEYIAARKRIIKTTSRSGYCYQVADVLDGYVMHDPKCPNWPNSAWSGHNCISEGGR